MIKNLALNKFLQACLVALLLICITFPDVIFNGASFRLTDQAVGGSVGTLARNVYPAPSTEGWWASYNDNGGALFQSEPMMEFMRNTIQSGQSPYWNPYSGGGSLGPETLVDQKFSFFTLLYSISWGGAGAYNFILLGLYFFAVMFLSLIICEHLNLSIYAAIAGSTFYLLNGYSTANFGSNVTQSYLYVPMCMYTALAFINRSSALRFISFVLAFSVFLSCTFIPTTITSVIPILFIVFGYMYAKIGWGRLSWAESIKLIGIMLLGMILVLMLLSFIYIPVVANILSVGEMETYAKRVFFPINFPQAIASLFSPSHFYQSYNAMEANALFWSDGVTKNGVTGNTVFHLGVVAIMLSGCAFKVYLNEYSRFIWISLVCIAFGFIRLFDPFPFDIIFSKIPVIGNIGCQYWWPPVIFPTIFLVAFGMDNLSKKNAQIIPAIALMLIGVFSLFYVYWIFGLQDPYYHFKKISLSLLACAFLVMTVLVANSLSKKSISSNKLIALILFLLFTELILDSKMMRLPRQDIFGGHSSVLDYVMNNVGLGRTLTFGQGGIYPELGSALKIQEATSFNLGVSPEYVKFLNKTISLGNSAQTFYGASLMLMQDKPELHHINWENINLLGIKFILLPIGFNAYHEILTNKGFHVLEKSGSAVLYENPHAMPRAFTVNSPIDQNGLDVILPLHYQTTLEPAKITKYENTYIEIQGNSSSNRLLVLTDNWNKNWAVEVNEKPADLIKVNGVFRGVIIPRGVYNVQMKYKSNVIFWSIIISLFSALMLILVATFRVGFSKTIDQFIYGKNPILNHIKNKC
ncbi:YfhO family protein [Polynucleobacter necessarius]|uniref:YfhO family protein n=1 Tax=Polynucleobacter necessarius TaxID=576610 RepID=UPI000E091F10|nr:YfhO family protein [Polynucleobacter necessarius]